MLLLLVSCKMVMPCATGNNQVVLLHLCLTALAPKAAQGFAEKVQQRLQCVESDRLLSLGHPVSQHRFTQGHRRAGQCTDT
jgi:hypothetical protein